MQQSNTNNYERSRDDTMMCSSSSSWLDSLSFSGTFNGQSFSYHQNNNVHGTTTTTTTTTTISVCEPTPIEDMHISTLPSLLPPVLNQEEYIAIQDVFRSIRDGDFKEQKHYSMITMNDTSYNTHNTGTTVSVPDSPYYSSSSSSSSTCQLVSSYPSSTSVTSSEASYSISWPNQDQSVEPIVASESLMLPTNNDYPTTTTTTTTSFFDNSTSSYWNENSPSSQNQNKFKNPISSSSKSPSQVLVNSVCTSPTTVTIMDGYENFDPNDIVKSLTPYHLFFLEERERLMEETKTGDGTIQNFTIGQYNPGNWTEQHKQQLLHKHWNRGSGKRKHRKIRGSIQFNKLSTIVSTRWRMLSPEGRCFYTSVADIDSKRYKYQIRRKKSLSLL